MAVCGYRCIWWVKRTNLERTLISLTVILFLTSLIIILVGVASHGGGPPPDNSALVMKQCSSKECIQTAGTMMSLMNPEVDPCENFYDFACGGYVKDRPYPSSVEDTALEAVTLRLKGWLESTLGANISVYEKARTLYKSCMNSASNGTSETIEKVFASEKVGNWPVLDSYWTDDTYIERTIASLIQLGIHVAFEFSTFDDSSRPGKKILRISPSHDLFPSNLTNSDEDLRALRTYIFSTLIELGIPVSRAVEAVEDIVSTEAEFIQRKRLADNECGNPSLDDEKRVLQDVRANDLKELKDLVPELDWNRLMTILDQENNAFKSFKNMTFEVYCRKYIRDLVERLVHYSPKTIFNYLGWKFLSPVIPHLGDHFRKLHWNYLASINGDGHFHPYEPKWGDCIKLLDKYMLPVIATAYRENEVLDAALDEKVKIASTLRWSLSTLLTSAEWLDESEKDFLKIQVKSSRFRLALTEITSKIDELDKYFSDLLLDEQAISNILKIRKFEMTKKFENMVTHSDFHLQWQNSSIFSSNLQYDGNVIAVHFDKIAPPYLYLNQPSYLSFGAFGTYAAHDLLKYISTFNLLEKVKGDKAIWEIFDLRHKDKSCHTVLHINSSTSKADVMNTIYPAMADFNSIRISYKGFKSLEDVIDDDSMPGLDYDSDQLFFISYAQSLCETTNGNNGYVQWGGLEMPPSRQRVNTVLQNFQPFTDTYQCQSGSSMKPSSVCEPLVS